MKFYYTVINFKKKYEVRQDRTQKVGHKFKSSGEQNLYDSWIWFLSKPMLLCEAHLNLKGSVYKLLTSKKKKSYEK